MELSSAAASERRFERRVLWFCGRITERVPASARVLPFELPRFHPRRDAACSRSRLFPLGCQCHGFRPPPTTRIVQRGQLVHRAANPIGLYLV